MATKRCASLVRKISSGDDIDCFEVTERNGLYFLSVINDLGLISLRRIGTWILDLGLV